MGNKKHGLVTVSDTKLSAGHYSGEMATLKIRHLSTQWKCLVAGTFAHHVPLLDRITTAIDRDTSREKLEKVCTAAFIAENKRVAEETVLATFGLTLEQFLKSRKDLGDSLFERTWADISRIKIDCQLLMCGFDSNPHVFVVENPEGNKVGFVTDCDFPGFAAIGSGTYLAESTLFALHQNPSTSLEETICITMFAKFAAEAATDVGRETYLTAFTADGSIEFDNVFTLETDLRKQWDQHGRPRAPEGAMAVISAHIKTKPNPSVAQTSEPEP
jgi:ATP-dependent protease HslVU (ClpYQ) peptidase subunit